ncbi:Ff.00g051340.m01.CDS01 [Fusarium sp. VM40]|nr:Ff.00g051340.m01.CDS01 [Fusarium sp. VM40]
MLSHLRFHRRGPASNPTSPSPDQNPTSPTAGHPASPFSPDALSPDLRPASSNPSALPPTLPPIDRVTTGDFGNSRDSRQYATTTSPINTRPQPASKTSSFIGGVALRKYQRDIEAQATEAPDNTRPGLVQQSASQPALTSNNLPLRPSPQFLRNTRATSSFSTPTEFQNSAAPTGRRPAGTRLTTELPSLTQTTSNTENPKAKKGLPFLKKPMSTLLMRRKNSQHAPDLRPLPLTKQREDPIYDPRIMGTRVHDFSAPRPKKNNTPSRENTQPSLPSPVPNSAPLPTQYRFLNPPDTQIDQTPLSASALTRREPSNASESIYSQDSRTLRMTPSTASAGVHAPIGDLDALVLSDAPPVPPKDDSPISVQPRSPQASRLIDEDAYIHERSSSSFRAGRSRGPSLSGLSGKDIASAIPRHMKSTSSRFSFDMVGAAKQEKILEDRHRQRELEKKTAEVPAARDSRFDDFDDDGFDYDAMMEDDGFEEEIPMVGDDFDDMDDGFNNGLNDDFNDYNINNMSSSKPLDAHLDNNMNNTLNRTMDDEPDEDFDPDDDQENFSGFVFQRSGPTSALTSPRSAGLLPTPRDAEGNRIGYAMSQYTPNMFASLSPSHPPDQRASQEMEAGGLGIQGLDVPRVPSLENEAAFQKNRDLPPIDTGRTLNDDELYYDDGMLEFESNEFAKDLAAPPEWDDTPFDESIFDNNDTDQFGRPIAGAFAQAQSQSLNRSGNQDETNRVSDTTAPFSAGSETSKTTAHTSLSAVEKQIDEPDAPQESLVTESSPEPSVVPLSSSPQDGDDSAAYQAALVAATFQAVASGKFQRGSSPPPDDSILSEQNRSPNSPDQDNSFRQDDYESFDDYGDYNDSYENMAEFELDDDAIIAEANADALANDCDGWYGQEFGFYSAAAGQQQTPDFEYANGGFFGPKGGLDRSASGRMISREPNLTPITERSEYSNRNSFMSLGMPSFGGTTPLQSPGLAQLALLGDRGDEMTLSALLRLRSRAWGGSQASLASSQNGSPREERGDLPMSPWGQSIMSPTTFHTRKNSVLSTISHESDSVSASGSPTLTGGIPGLMLSPPPVPSLAKLETGVKEGAQVAPLNVSRPTSRTFDKPISPISDSEESMPPSAMVSPLEPSNRASTASMAESSSSPKRPGLGHRHKGSADSISYTKEEDSGATRWVMERRRTGESGQVEILEREVLEGGRI